jgi:hypothetical protein
MYFISVEPVFTASCIVCGIITLFAAVITTLKVCKDSKSHFAYLQLTFTFGFAIDYFVVAIYNTLPKTVS